MYKNLTFDIVLFDIISKANIRDHIIDMHGKDLSTKYCAQENNIKVKPFNSKYIINEYPNNIQHILK